MTSRDDDAGRSRGKDYDIGYGKPPKHTRFVKGQSGNPVGRPRKPKPRPLALSDAPSASLFAQEIYRMVPLRENGEKVELTMLQAMLRAAMTNAVKGNRLQFKYLFEQARELEEMHLKYKHMHYVRLEQQKRDGERRLADRAGRGLPPPHLLPHPEDIVLNPYTFEACVNGPETVEDERMYEHLAELRDHLAVRAVHAGEFDGPVSPRDGNAPTCVHMVFARWCDSLMPPRYRWKEIGAIGIVMDAQCLTKRERQKRIDREWAQLQATKPPSLYITPKVQAELDKLLTRWDAHRRRSQQARAPQAGTTKP